MISILLFLAINVVPYGLLIFGLYKLHRRFRNIPKLLGVAAIVAVGYGAIYIPSIQQRIAFHSWADAHPKLEVFQDANISPDDGILLPHGGCSGLCMDLLLKGHFSFVETGSRWGKADGDRYKSHGQEYSRWTVIRDPDICWQKDVAEHALAVTKTHMRGLLAQGVCFRHLPTVSPSAVLRFTRDQKEQNTTHSDGQAFSYSVYEAHKVTSKQKSILARGHYRLEGTLFFPLIFGVKATFFVPRGVEVLNTTLEHGVAGLNRFTEVVLGVDPLGAMSYSGPLLSKKHLKTIQRAVTNKSAHVRWSAALAICGLKRENPELFGSWINPLLTDENPKVQAAAQEVDKQRPGQNLCGFPRGI